MDEDEKIETAVAAIEKESAEQPEIQADQSAETAPETVSGEDTKPSEDAKPEGESPIEAPSSWPSDDKEAFKSLPTWAQETISRREHEREAAFTQRSMDIANRNRQVADLERKAQDTTARYSAQLEEVRRLASQLMPARFQDIVTREDFIRLKQTDPARASEYEAFQMMLGSANEQYERVQKAQLDERLDREWMTLSEKFPEFKDPVKAEPIMNRVRKATVEWYGFAPDEVKIIGDHRYIPIVRDAIAWREHQANLKTVAAKKASPLPQRVIQPRAGSGTTLTDDRKAASLNKARNTDNLHEKAALVASLLA